MTNRLSSRRRLIFLTLIVWLCAMWSGLHGHFCFDGQEPPVSIHMDLFHGHPDHAHDDDTHVDADAELIQTSFLKFTKLELPALIVALVYVLLQVIARPQYAQPRLQATIKQHIHLRPPLRAPPAVSS